jgi:oxygen-independent coproporphyrinogen-3 oxidase
VDDYLDHLEREFDLAGIVGRGRRAVHAAAPGRGHAEPPQRQRLVRLHMVAERFGSWTAALVEADPRLVTDEQMRLLRALGFRRLSLGVQDFDPTVQAQIGRVQPVGVVRDATVLARDAGLDGITSTWFYGLPAQTRGSLRARWTRCWNSARPHQPATATRTCPGANQRLIDESQLPGRGRFALFTHCRAAIHGGGLRVGGGWTTSPAPTTSWRACRAGATAAPRLHGLPTRPAPHLLAFPDERQQRRGGLLLAEHPRTGEYARRWRGASCRWSAATA